MRILKVDCGFYTILRAGCLIGLSICQIELHSYDILAVAPQCLLFTCAASQDSSQPAHQRFLNKVFSGRLIDSKSSNAFSAKTGQTVRLRWLIYVFPECTCEKNRRLCYVKLGDFSF